jgi:hypothetical protein
MSVAPRCLEILTEETGEDEAWFLLPVRAKKEKALY